MLASISPLGERARGHRWWTTAIMYLIATALGGATMGGVAAAAGTLVLHLSPSAAAALAALLAAGALIAEVSPWRYPTWHRQVNENWLSAYRAWVYAVGFGFQLGLGLTTIVTSTSTYFVAAAAFVSGSPLRGTIIGVTFGVARALPLFTMARATSADRLRSCHARFQAHAHTADVAARSAVAAAAIALGVVAVGSGT